MINDDSWGSFHRSLFFLFRLRFEESVFHINVFFASTLFDRVCSLHMLISVHLKTAKSTGSSHLFFIAYFHVLTNQKQRLIVFFGCKLERIFNRRK